VDSVRYEVCDDGTPAGCSQAVVYIDVTDLPLRIYEGVSPNGDGINDYWRMDGIDFYPENVVRVFDRYNNLVYEMTNYNNEDRVWRGEANSGMFRGKLPDGVYFYNIRVSSDIPELSGFVILKMEK
jgi:gliding motility-associated-like protein